MGKVSGGAGRQRAAVPGAVALGRQPGAANAGGDQAQRILAEVQRMGLAPATNPGVTVRRAGTPIRISADPAGGMRWAQSGQINAGDPVRIARYPPDGRTDSWRVTNLRTQQEVGNIQPGRSFNPVEHRSAIRAWARNAGITIADSSDL